MDNLSKYGPWSQSYDDHPGYRFVEGDARDTELMTELLADCDHFIAGAAMIGGISYFHTYAYDLLATNERIIASSCDAAIEAHRDGPAAEGHVHELVDGVRVDDTWPSYEGTSARFRRRCRRTASRSSRSSTSRAPRGTSTGCRTRSCGRSTASASAKHAPLGDVEVLSGNVKLAMSHVVPDLVQKVLKGQDPLHILGDGSQIRHYTYGGDLARGIVIAMEHARRANDDFNLSTAESTTVLELAELIWTKINGAARPFRYVSDDPFEHDVQKRVPATEKARDVLGFEATTSLSTTCSTRSSPGFANRWTPGSSN